MFSGEQGPTLTPCNIFPIMSIYPQYRQESKTTFLLGNCMELGTGEQMEFLGGFMGGERVNGILNKPSKVKLVGSSNLLKHGLSSACKSLSLALLSPSLFFLKNIV